MVKSGWILVAILTIGLDASASTGTGRLFDHLLDVPPEVACEFALSRANALRESIEALPIRNESAIWLDASMYLPRSPLMQATSSNPKNIEDDTALAMRAHGFSMAFDHLRQQVVLMREDRQIHRWSLSQPIAEVRFNETDDHRLEFALVGWVGAEYFVVDGEKLVPASAPSSKIRVPLSHLEITKPVAEAFEISYDQKRAAARDSSYFADLARTIRLQHARVSAWLPARAHAEPTEDVARMAQLARRPKPSSYLKQALGELTVELLAHARAICDRRINEGPLSSRTYPNQLLGVAADLVRMDEDVQERLVRAINEHDVDGLRATVLPRPAIEPITDDGRDLISIKILGCSPLVFSVPPDPIAGSRGWGVLRSTSEI